MRNEVLINNDQRSGFSLIEVVLAIGIFLVTVLALVGLLGPTLQSVDEVEKGDEVASVVNTLNAFLQSSPDIAPDASKFDAIFEAVLHEGEATVLIFRHYSSQEDSNGNPVVRLAVGFVDNEGGTIDSLAVVDSNALENIAGPLYRVVLTPSPALPEEHRSEARNSNGVYELRNDGASLADYPEGYFAMEVRIYALESDMVVANGSALPSLSLSQLNREQPIFTYNTAVVR